MLRLIQANHYPKKDRPLKEGITNMGDLTRKEHTVAIVHVE